MPKPTYEVECEVCGDTLGGGYVAKSTSILAVALEHDEEHAEQDALVKEAEPEKSA